MEPQVPCLAPSACSSHLSWSLHALHAMGWKVRVDTSGTCLQPGSPRKNQEPLASHHAAETLPRPRGTVVIVASHVNKTVQRSHPNEIPPKCRCCGMFNFELLRGETSGSAEARGGDT